MQSLGIGPLSHLEARVVVLGGSNQDAVSFNQYTEPLPDTPFSFAFFNALTVAAADDMVKTNNLPEVLPDNSILRWEFDTRIPTDPQNVTLSCREMIPSLRDLLPITRAMEFAYPSDSGGARSVLIWFTSMPDRPVQYHLSKIRLMLNMNNNLYPIKSASNLLRHLEQNNLLLPHLVQTFAHTRVIEPLAGFYVTRTPIWTLGCLLDERWAGEDILNARAELTYFRRAVLTMEIEPSFLYLPTCFLNDCRTLFSLPGPRQYSQNIIDLRERIRAGMVKTVAFLAWTSEHYAALVKVSLQDIELGDSLHQGPAEDIFIMLRWVLAGLATHEIGPNTQIRPGAIDRQSALAGGGSCGIAGTNFVEVRANIGVEPWRAKRSEAFRDEMLRDLLLFHLIAKRKTSSFGTWVVPCTLASVGEKISFDPAGVGYNDFNLYMPAENVSIHTLSQDLPS
ncbi:hypothetical protein C8R47DRAFT_242718, partial [Mycena vitilis]